MLLFHIFQWNKISPIKNRLTRDSEIQIALLWILQILCFSNSIFWITCTTKLSKYSNEHSVPSIFYYFSITTSYLESPVIMLLIPLLQLLTFTFAILESTLFKEIIKFDLRFWNYWKFWKCLKKYWKKNLRKVWDQIFTSNELIFRKTVKLPFNYLDRIDTLYIFENYLKSPNYRLQKAQDDMRKNC